MSDQPADEPSSEHDGLLAQVQAPTTIEIEGDFGMALAHVEPGPDRGPDGEGQDAALLIPTAQGLVLAVADGVGGTRGGAAASRLAVETLREALLTADELGIREAIMDAFDQADLSAHASSNVGSTTLLVTEIDDGVLRTYNTGDSEALLVGGRGKIKLRTVAHSPVGYQVAAGVLDDAEAIHHDLRHFISNVVGTGEMRIDVGPRTPLATQDTLAMGSDGLFDNVTVEEIATIISQGQLADAADTLIQLARQRMDAPSPGEPSKPDDLSLVLFRPRGR